LRRKTTPDPTRPNPTRSERASGQVFASPECAAQGIDARTDAFRTRARCERTTRDEEGRTKQFFFLFFSFFFISFEGVCRGLGKEGAAEPRAPFFPTYLPFAARKQSVVLLRPARASSKLFSAAEPASQPSAQQARAHTLARPHSDPISKQPTQSQSEPG